MLKKPQRIKGDRFLSAKWKELTKGRNFEQYQAPLIESLCIWYQVADKAMEQMTAEGSLEVSYVNKFDDIKERPEINTLKKATAEIRALNKLLQIDDDAMPMPMPKQNKLTQIQGKYKNGLRVVGED